MFEWQTTVGSPARFDSTFVNGAVGISSNGIGSKTAAFVQIPLIMDATNVSGTLWGKFSYLPNGNAYNAQTDLLSIFSLLNSSGVVIIDLNNPGFFSNIWQFRYWNGSSYVNLGASFSITDIARLDFSFRLVHGASGTFDCWINGALIASGTGLPAAVNNTSFLRICAGYSTSAFAYVSQVALADFDLRSYYFPEDTLNAFGTYNEGTGTIAGQGDVDLATTYTLAANGNRMTGTTAARTLPSGAFIRSVQVTGIERANSPIANSQKMLRISGADYNSASVTPVPTGGLEPRGAYWDTNPAGGDWDISSYNSAEKGHRAVT